MKKKYIICALLAICAIIVACEAVFTPSGKTIDEREEMLDKAISRGGSWTIVRETEVDGYIVSAAHGENGENTLAVFQPVSGGKYRLNTRTNRKSGEVIIGGATINGSWYELIWFDGAETEYAEVNFKFGDGEWGEPMHFDTRNGDIIYIENNACLENGEGEYAMQVDYYDADGNRYGRD